MSESLQRVIEKNQQKLDQNKPPRTPQIKDLYNLSIMYKCPNSKSSSIDRSYQTGLNSRKSTKISFMLPNKQDLSRLVDQSSPLSMKSQKNSMFGEALAFNATVGDSHINKLTKENAELREKNQQKDRQIEKLLSGSMLRHHQQLAEQYRREKEILQQQLNTSISHLSRELEIQKKNYQNIEIAQIEQITTLKGESEKYEQLLIKHREVEQMMQKLIIENEQLKQQKSEDSKWQSQIQEQFEMFYTKTLEQKLKLLDTKHYAFLVTQISHFLIHKQNPPLDFLVQINKMQKQIRIDQETSILPQGSSLKMVFAQVFTLQVEILVLLQQIMKDLKQQVERYQNNYISEVGMHLVSIQ